MMSQLSIKNLSVNVQGKPILNDISISFSSGQIHAIMGRNGSGKSSLIKTIMGHPEYEVSQGEIVFIDRHETEHNILELSIEERAQLGIFMSFQHPIEVPGLINQNFLKTAYNCVQKARGNQELDSYDFQKLLEKKALDLSYHLDFLKRGLNVGFSGGEKKRNEILQLALLDPSFAFLDEIDSGLDIDALHLMLEQLKKLRTKDNTMVFITHYENIIHAIQPDFIHIMHQGKLILSTNDSSIAQQIGEQGFDFLTQGQDTL